MSVVAFTLAQLLHICAPDVGARTMTAIVQVESGDNPLAIHDNTLRRSFAPRDARQAVAWANQLLALHHSVDLGLSQINNANLPRLGMSVTEAFDACSNLSGASLILAADYRSAAQQFGPGQYALRSAIGAYNAGSLFAGYAYINRILLAAGIGASQANPMPDLQGAPLAARFASAARSRAADAPAPAAPATPPVPLAAPVRVTMPVRVAVVKPHTPHHAAHKGSILITAGFSPLSRVANASVFLPNQTNSSAIMLRVAPPTAAALQAH